MADLKFKVIADDSSLGVTLQGTNNALNKTGATAKKMNQELKTGFKQSADESKKLNDTLDDAPPILDKTVDSIKGLKQQIRDYTNAAIKAGETSPIGQEFLKKAGEAKDRLGDLQQTVKGFGSDTRTFDGLIQGASTAAAAFSIFHGVSALVGEENKDLQKTLVKLGAATSILTGLQQIQNALQKESQLIKLKDLILDKARAASNLIYATSLGIASGGLSFYTVAANIAAAATKALLGPIGIVLTVIGTLAGAFALFSTETGKSTEEIRKSEKALNDEKIAALELENQLQALIDKRQEAEGQIKSDEVERRNVTREFQQQRIKDEEKFQQDQFDLVEKYKDKGFKSTTEALQANIKLAEDYQKLQEQRSQEFQEKVATINIGANNAEKERLAALAKTNADKKKETDSKYLDQLKKQKEEEKRLEEEFIALLLSLTKKSVEAQINLANPREAVELRKQQQLKELADFKENLRLKNVAVNRTFLFSAEQEKQFALLKLEIEKKAADDQNKITEDGLNKGKELLNKSLDDLKKNLELKTLIIQNQQKREGVSAADFEHIKNRQVLEAQIQSYSEQIELLKDKTDTDSKIIVEGLKKAITTAQSELDKKPPFDLARLLGFDGPDDPKFKALAASIAATLQTITKVFDEQIKAQQDLLDKKKELAQEEIDADNNRLSELKGNLDDEIKLHNAGFASNVDAVRAEIKAVEEARRQALIKQAAINAQQAKLDRLRRIEEAATQVSSLITASAKNFASLPFPLAVILNALMFGSFAAAKIKAAQITKLKHGGKLKGRTHDEGGNPLYEAEKDEWYINRKSSQKHDKLLDSINRDDFSKLKPVDIIPLLKGTGVTLNMDVPNKIAKNNTIVRAAQAEASFGNASTDMRLDKIEKVVTNFYGHYKNKPSYSDDGKTKTYKQGNFTKRIKKG